MGIHEVSVSTSREGRGLKDLFSTFRILDGDTQETVDAGNVRDIGDDIDKIYSVRRIAEMHVQLMSSPEAIVSCAMNTQYGRIID